MDSIQCRKRVALTDIPPPLKCYTAALDEDPTLTSAHSALSLAYLKLKRNGDALQSAEKALALDTKCEPAFHRKGQVQRYYIYECGICTSFINNEIYVLDYTYYLCGIIFITKWKSDLGLTSSSVISIRAKFKLQACFALENYSDALTSFKAGQTLCKTEQQINNTRQYDMWTRKCEVELNDDAEKKEKQNKQVFQFQSLSHLLEYKLIYALLFFAHLFDT